MMRTDKPVSEAEVIRRAKAFENMPESLQEGDRGQASQSAMEELESACEAIGAAFDSIEEAQGSIASAKGE